MDSIFILACLTREVALFALLTVAVYGDIKYGRIFNWLTFPALFLGLGIAFGLSGSVPGHEGILNHILAAIIPIGIFGIPYALGWFGGGDIKMLAAVGALEGPHFVLHAMFFTGIAGGLLVFVMMLIRLRPIPVHESVDAVVSEDTGLVPERLPYGVAIATGTAVAWFLTVM